MEKRNKYFIWGTTVLLSIVLGIGQTQRQDAIPMMLNLGKLANKTINPHQTSKEVISAEPLVPFEKSHGSNYSFVLQVTEKDNVKEPPGD
ncbi:hypothetical protein [Lactococcus kimchii]|uniref:hypothetical protein n=1 Tax=Lactococcus sp. S-13 TaxID=2507158 RepID=UPI001023B564|nr:hypothetical protein [Lactococcus sp. S-13]RZI49312.1 hypothetical protein EQJ87_07575 [Lactococcus sp. S-13]